jgi:cellulose synthase/poly-beta-1,6-N-acetylglucosamine synthase-like glycosyltransferase
MATAVGLSGLYWLVSGVLAVLTRRSLQSLDELHPKEPAVYPRLSLIIPACNEADTVEAAVLSRLADDYPDLEVALVDDRSTDATGAIVDRLAAQDPRVKAVHVTALPGGWLGKLNAQEVGQRATSGAWLLFSDADVHFAPGTLRRAVAWAEERQLDHLAVMPRLVAKGFWLCVTLSTVVRTILISIRAWAIEDPKSSAFMGVGAFNLVRRSAWEKTKGFEWLRLEPIDDMGIGLLMKRSGFRSALVGGQKLVSVEWYPSVRALAVGSERASFTLCNCSLIIALAVAFASVVAELGFLAAFLPGAGPILRVAGGATLLVALATTLVVDAWSDIPFAAGLLFPVGAVLQAFALVRAGILGALRGGIVWRGTLYPTALLRAGRRVKLGA